MEPISTEDRKVRNIKADTYQPFIDSNGEPDGDVLQANPDNKPGYGFHIYRMAPGDTTTAHIHADAEEFYVIDGEVFDHDGFRYGPGDLVWLRKGTKHNSHSPSGCTLVVYYPGEIEEPSS